MGTKMKRPKYQVLPDMTPEQFKALKKDIAERGVITPIDLDENGVILDGHHRIRACKELGITDYPTIVRLKLSENDKRIFARKSNMMRRHLNRQQIRELIIGQLKDTPEWANNRIALELGVDSKTVKSIRTQLESTSEIPKLNKLKGIDGKTRDNKKPSVMLPDEKKRMEILNKLKADGINIDKLINNESMNDFLSGESEGTILDISYNPWYEQTKKSKKKWLAYFSTFPKKYRPDKFSEIEWILQRPFQFDEWFGMESRNFRKHCGKYTNDKHDNEVWEHAHKLANEKLAKGFDTEEFLKTGKIVYKK